MAQPNSDIGAPRRAFSLKMAYMRTVLQFVLESEEKAVKNFEYPTEQLVTEEELTNQSFDEILLERFSPFIGKSFLAISSAE